MSPLAEAIYLILRSRTFLSEPRITYKDLAAELRDSDPAFEHVHHRHQQLYVALGEVGAECRRLRLPPLPALVVRADTKRPGAAYYTARIAGRPYRGEQIRAWRQDLEAVKGTRYPKIKRRRRAKTELPSINKIMTQKS
jgi:hypothetical protein